MDLQVEMIHSLSLTYRAATHLAKYTPQEDGEARDRTDVAPLAEFFELVHIADLIQQMVEVYWKEEMVSVTWDVDSHLFERHTHVCVFAKEQNCRQTRFLE